jgi:hypothetical protein
VILRRTALVIGAVLGLGVAAYFLMPGPVTSHSLGYSVANQVEGATLTAFRDPSCRETGRDDRWRGRVEDPSGSGGGTTYEVRMRSLTMKGWTCWKARRTGPARGSETRFPETGQGCVRVSDYLRIGQRVLDAI